MNKLSVQQYTFLSWAEKEGFWPVLEKVSKMGYTDLEMCFFGGFEPLNMTAKEMKARLDDLGISMIGNHFTRSKFQGDHSEAFAYIAEAGGKYAIYNIWGVYDSEEEVLRKAEYLNSLAPIAKKEGITLLYHNHGQEFVSLNGRLIIDRLAEVLNPDVFFEHDVFFSTQQDCDACAFLKNNADRVKTVHLKQIDNNKENVDLPDGIIDMAKVISCAPKATHFIVEQASFKESVEESLKRNAEFIKNL